MTCSLTAPQEGIAFFFKRESSLIKSLYKEQTKF